MSSTLSSKTPLKHVSSKTLNPTSIPAALQRLEMTLHTFKRLLKASLFHIWCANEQKKHPPPPGVVVFFMILVSGYKNADLLQHHRNMCSHVLKENTHLLPPNE